jgi:hypothetical protein
MDSRSSKKEVFVKKNDLKEEMATTYRSKLRKYLKTVLFLGREKHARDPVDKFSGVETRWECLINIKHSP